jgi:glycosyltransferase involved in cell wall biosynthesis
LITVIATVLNEGESMNRLMLSLLKQSLQPDEIVIVDGGSHDQTVEIIRRYADRLAVRVLVEAGCNISQGRNRAIAAAQGDIIAVTDAGVSLSPDWLYHLTQPFEDEQVQVVAGFFQADSHTTFEVAMGATVLPLVDEIDPTTFLPSSRSIAFRKTVWEEVGGYPEWLDYCEDLIFDLRLKETVLGFVFAPDALVYFRPRGSLSSFYKQYYLYARGDGKADLWRKRHAIRYLTYLGVIPGVFLLGIFIHQLLWLLYLPGMIIYLYRPFQRLPQVMKTAPDASVRLQAASLIPVIRIIGDIAKMAGYPVGWWWRWRHHPPDWRSAHRGRF